MALAVAGRSLTKKKSLRKIEQAVAQESEDVFAQEHDLLCLTELAFSAMENSVKMLFLTISFCHIFFCKMKCLLASDFLRSVGNGHWEQKCQKLQKDVGVPEKDGN